MLVLREELRGCEYEYRRLGIPPQLLQPLHELLSICLRRTGEVVKVVHLDRSVIVSPLQEFNHLIGGEDEEGVYDEMHPLQQRP